MLGAICIEKPREINIDSKKWAPEPKDYLGILCLGIRVLSTPDYSNASADCLKYF